MNSRSFSSCLGRIGRAWASLAFAMLLVGEAAALGRGVVPSASITPPSVEPSPLPGRLEQRLKALQTQLIESARRVDLETAVRSGLRNHPVLTAAHAEIEGGEWKHVAARRRGSPTLRAAASPLIGRNISSQDSPPVIPVGPQLAGATAAYEVLPILAIEWTFLDPSRDASIRAAAAGLEGDRLLFDIAARDLVLELSSHYFQLQALLELIESYEEIYAFTTWQVARSEALFNAGLRSIADVEQIRGERLDQLEDLIATHQQLVSHSAELAAAMALPAGSLALPDEPLATTPGWSLSLAETLRQAEALREEVQVKLARAASASSQATALLLRSWPRLSLTAVGGIGREARSDADSSTRPARLDGAVGVGFEWLIFDGGLLAAEANVSRAEAERLEAEAERQRLAVGSEVMRAHARYESSRLAIETGQARVESSLAALRALEARYELGYTDTTSVLQGLQLAVGAARDHIESIRNHNTAVASL